MRIKGIVTNWLDEDEAGGFTWDCELTATMDDNGVVTIVAFLSGKKMLLSFNQHDLEGENSGD